MELSTIKQYLKVDFDDDDELIRSMQKAAEDYLKNAGVTCSYESDLYQLAVLLLVTNWYENRNAVLTGMVNSKLEYSLKHILAQLMD